MKIYVGNLSFETTESQINEAFSQHGEVQDVAIINDRMTGRSRGFGFVEIRNEQKAKEAIDALNGTEFGGRHITVNEARPRNDRGGPKRDRW
ncbi:MAG: RNA recognition motif domain-containing protein [Planctomycetota bacterium]|jgi:RNA recognition motif-containing protein